jgi:cadmium resistance protein CadD (predicted permease)
VDRPAGTLLAAAGVFAGTNIDDLIVLTVLFLSSRAGHRPRRWQIWAGQYTGIGLLVVLSAGIAAGLSVVPDDWVGLLGLVPFVLGARGLAEAYRARGNGTDPEPFGTGGLPAVAGITVANGADNISVYAPLFRAIGPGSTAVTVAVFAALVAVWCLTASWLGSHRRVVAAVRRFGHWLVPATFVALGAVIVLESGVVARTAELF